MVFSEKFIEFINLLKDKEFKDEDEFFEFFENLSHLFGKRNNKMVRFLNLEELNTSITLSKAKSIKMIYVNKPYVTSGEDKKHTVVVSFENYNMSSKKYATEEDANIARLSVVEKLDNFIDGIEVEEDVEAEDVFIWKENGQWVVRLMEPIEDYDEYDKDFIQDQDLNGFYETEKEAIDFAKFVTGCPVNPIKPKIDKAITYWRDEKSNEKWLCQLENGQILAFASWEELKIEIKESFLEEGKNTIKEKNEYKVKK